MDSNESIVDPQVESHQNKEPCKRGAQYSINSRREEKNTKDVEILDITTDLMA